MSIRTAAAAARRRGGLVRGVAGLVLLFCALGSLHALTIPPFLPADEQAHYGYALSVSAGELPTIDSPIPATSSEALRARLRADADPRRDVWTANHPPLHPALIALPVGAGERSARPVAGLVGARLVGVAAGACALVAAVWLGLQLVPRRPPVALLAAAIVGTLPLVAHVSAFAYNDALALLTTTATVAAAAAALRHGPSSRLVAAVAVSASAAALTRASGLAAAAVGVAALAWAGAACGGGCGPGAEGRAHRPEMGRRREVGRRLRAGLLAATPAALAVAVSSGWFYLRNVRLYGDLTGASALFAKFERSEPGFGTLADATLWRVQADHLWNGFAGATSALGQRWIPLAWAMAAVLLAGMAVAGGRWLLARRRPGTGAEARAGAGAETRAGAGAGGGAGTAAPSGPPAPLGRRLSPWLPPAANAAIVTASIARFVAGGGGAHPRYWFPVLPLLALVAAAGLAPPAGRRRALVPIALVLVEVGIGLLAWGRFAVQRYPEVSAEPLWQLPGAVLAAAGMPAPDLVLAALATCGSAGLVLLGWSLAEADDQAPSQASRHRH